MPAHPPGPRDPEDSVPLRAAREAAVRAGVRGVLLDPALDTGAWRWDAERMAGLSARVHAGETR